MKRRPAHTPPFLSPTAYGCASAVLGAGLYLAAVQTGSDACMAGALAILLSHIVSFGVALSAFLDEKWRDETRRTHAAARVAHAIARMAADRHARVTYDRIDQAGRVVATLTLGLPPRERGVYQASDKLVTTTGPLWLWRSNARAAMDGELLRPPSNVDASDAAGAATLAQDGPGARVASELDTSLVRPYQRGDQVNAIAWRQTAHHGRLMSYERRRIAHARVLVVPDTSSATSPADADALHPTRLPSGNPSSARAERAPSGCMPSLPMARFNWTMTHPFSATARRCIQSRRKARRMHAPERTALSTPRMQCARGRSSSSP